jgi:hypothetical protein
MPHLWMFVLPPLNVALQGRLRDSKLRVDNERGHGMFGVSLFCRDILGPHLDEQRIFAYAKLRVARKL